MTNANICKGVKENGNCSRFFKLKLSLRSFKRWKARKRRCHGNLYSHIVGLRRGINSIGPRDKAHCSRLSIHIPVRLKAKVFILLMFTRSIQANSIFFEFSFIELRGETCYAKLIRFSSQDNFEAN